ncbi:cation:proton antiporter [Geminocystis sp. NIES-3709]|uniref:cation:proton antiporter domain-containing protein n=1 Tax=Geminocystis sp. NIES-3709 TaxID=1617448 RepID=UPI0005FC548A|nr:cation:proton antiporter [Geminocystis sp. NIES-3709]BAQ66893.1 sodium/hydrogen exchanger family protein [Geminocystis sp. NIES-3709]
MTDLIALFSAAAIGGLLAYILRQPIILGYLFAGIIVGPFELGLIHDYEIVHTVAELGVTFLLFAIGVEFSFAELNKVKNISLGGGGLQIVLTIAITAFVSVTVGWVTTIPQGIFLGELLSLSSTAVVLKALMESNETSTSHGQVMLGILIIQDLALGLMLAVLPALNQPIDQIGVAIAIALLKLALFALGAIAVGKWLIPPYLKLLAKTESKEIFLLGVVALCLCIALLTGEIGLSTEMGAFVAGLMISEVEYSDQTLDYVEPLRDICAAAFFVAIGILIDPLFLWQNLALIMGLVSLVLIGKSFVITPLVILFRYPVKTAIITGLGLAQIGEFSFVLADEGRSFGLISQEVYMFILGTTAMTLVVTPFVLQFLPIILSKAESSTKFESWLTKLEKPIEISEQCGLKNHVIVCGYGRVGKNVVKLLLNQGHKVLVIDQSEEKIKTLRKKNIPYLYGSASSLVLLEKAEVCTAKAMAIALPDSMSSRLCVKRALQINPELDMVVRANDAEDIEMLYQLGAKEVIQPEFEASLELSAHLLRVLGLPKFAIQQEIQQIRQSQYSQLQPERSEEEILRELEEAVSTMNNKWYNLPDDSSLIGMTLEKAHIRRLTGVSIIEIQRPNGEKLDYPPAQTMLEKGDKLLLVGAPEDFEAFDYVVKEKVMLPKDGESCIWVSIPKNNDLATQKLEEIKRKQELGIMVQGIRRKNQYIRFPDLQKDIKAGDNILLFGKLDILNEFQMNI